MSSPTTTPQINVDVADAHRKVAELDTNIADVEQTLASQKAEFDASLRVIDEVKQAWLKDSEEIAAANNTFAATAGAKDEAEKARLAAHAIGSSAAEITAAEDAAKLAKDKWEAAVNILDNAQMKKTEATTAISAQETKCVQLESAMETTQTSLNKMRKERDDALTAVVAMQDTMTPATKPAQLSVDVLRILSSPAVERFHLASSVLEDNYSTLRREYQEECQYGERMKLLQTALDSDNVNDITILFDNAKMRRESTIELGKRMQDINDYLRKVATANDELEKKLTNQTTFNPDAVALANEAANIFITALNMSKKIEAEYEVIKALIQNRKAGVRTPSPPLV